MVRRYFPYVVQAVRALLSNFPRVHMPQIQWTKHGHQCLWLPDVLLYHDIEFNPGLMEKRPKCVTCNTTVQRNQAAILCSNCASCFQAKCSGLSKDVLNNIYNSFDTWFWLLTWKTRIQDQVLRSVTRRGKTCV